MTRVARALLVFVLMLAPAVSVKAEAGWILVAPLVDEKFRAVMNDVWKAQTLQVVDATAFIERRHRMDDAEWERVFAVFVPNLGIEDEVERAVHLFESSLRLNAPLHEWMHVRAFDSAEACEDTKHRVRESSSQKVDSLRGMRPTTDAELEKIAAWVRIRTMRCLPVSVAFPPAR